jgi:hypothetical protein
MYTALGPPPAITKLAHDRTIGGFGNEFEVAVLEVLYFVATKGRFLRRPDGLAREFTNINLNKPKYHL